MFGKGLLKGLAITFGHTFEKDITVQYPEVMPELQERFRGCLALNSGKCIVCGLCTKACPNNVLSYETVQKAGSKKKLLRSYTIDLQYCMFCNLCVEACSTSSLYFTHNFELSTYNRGDIKIIYDFPEAAEIAVTGELEILPDDGGSSEPGTSEAVPSPEAVDAEAEKLLKKAAAFQTALSKNPSKSLARLTGSPEDLELLVEVVAGDEKRLTMMAELMAKDMEKAAKVAAGLINKARKDRAKGEAQS